MYFCEDETAYKTSKYVKINRNTINRIYMLFRERILELSIQENGFDPGGEFEIDESYFGAKRIRGKYFTNIFLCNG